MVETDFYAALSTAPLVTAIVANRVYPLVLPDEVTLPAIDYSFIGGSSTPTQDTFGSQRYRVEVNCWGETYLDAVNLRHAVIASIGRYSLGGMTITFLQPTDFFDHELLQYRAMCEFYVFHNFGS